MFKRLFLATPHNVTIVDEPRLKALEDAVREMQKTLASILESKKEEVAAPKEVDDAPKVEIPPEVPIVEPPPVELREIHVEHDDVAPSESSFTIE